MEEDIFLEEKQKLKEVIQKITEEETELENTLSSSDMNYDLMRRLQEEPSEEHLWDMILSYQNIMFKTYSGLPFTYEVRKGRNGEYTKELWIDRREKSKSLAWSSVKLAFHNIKQTGEIVERPKALGDIRGVTYIYGMFYRFGLIDVPDKVKEKMKEI